jgi:hypothetical protein
MPRRNTGWSPPNDDPWSVELNKRAEELRDDLGRLLPIIGRG